jgi:HEAT repeat protein
MSDNEINKYQSWLSSEDPYQREIGLNVIWHTKQRSQDIDNKVILLLRTDDNLNIRRDAIRMISSAKDEKFIPVLLESLKDDDWLVRGEAILGLKKIDPTIISKPEITEFVEKEIHPFCRWCIQSN